MIQCIVCSDSHGRESELNAIREQFKDAKCFIHCGDSEFSADELSGFYSVRGNCDYDWNFPNDCVVEFGSERIYVTHGHLLGYGDIEMELVIRAKAHDCSIACYGHTHIPTITKRDGVLILNPGSIVHNRDGSPQSFAIITLESGKIEIDPFLVRDL